MGILSGNKHAFYTKQINYFNY